MWWFISWSHEHATVHIWSSCSRFRKLILMWSHVIVSGWSCQLPPTRNLRHREQEQPGDEGNLNLRIKTTSWQLITPHHDDVISFFLPFQSPEDENSDNSSECVVCLSDVRDTLILPCRHLCLCNACADTLRYQANNCPICRLRECVMTLREHWSWITGR